MHNPLHDVLTEVMTLGMMIDLLTVLGSYVVATSDEVNPIVTIQPGSALQDYLCSGHLKSNVTIALDDGEHRISSEPLCGISWEGSITFVGSSTKRTVILCDVKLKGRAFSFVSLQMLTMARITFVNCGMGLASIENTFIRNCAFLNSSNGAISLKSSSDIYITNSVFSDTHGGAVILDGPTGNVSISDCTFQNNRTFDGSAMTFRGSTGNLSITNCTFHNAAPAVTMHGSTRNIEILESTFRNNFAKNNFAIISSVNLEGPMENVYITKCTFENCRSALLLKPLSGNVCITNCTFQNNIDSVYVASAVGILGTGSNISFTHCTFQDNSATAVMANLFTGNIHITHCNFQNNSSVNNGGAVSLNDATGNYSITSCTFQNNRASILGGAVMMYNIAGNVRIANSTFHLNSGYLGGAVLFSKSLNVFITMSSFTSNSASAGAAIFATYDDSRHYHSITVHEEINQLVLQDVIVKYNHCSSDTCAGAIYFKGVKMDIFGNTGTGSHFSFNFPQGAIQGEKGYLLLHGYITFENNTGVNGGAISLSNDAPLYFNPTSTVEFSRNVAIGYGGAIYNNGKQFISNQALDGNCILRFIVGAYNCNSRFTITFIHNHALRGGHAIYATPMPHKCVFYSSNYWQFENNCSINDQMKFTPLLDDSNDGQVLSFPEHVNYCGCSDPNLCNGTSQYLTTYPGRTVRLNVTSVDHQDKLSPSVVYTQVDTSGHQQITLGSQQSTQWIGTVCGIIEYQIYGPEKTSLKLLLSNDPNGSPTVIYVMLLPCEPGFTLISNSSTSGMKCDCSQFFTSLGVACDTSDGTVTRSKTNWIGVYNNTDPALAETCPLDYCNSTIKKLSPARPGYLCNGGRTGIICGHCHGNLSVIFGSSKCQECSDMWLTTLVMFAVLGVILVAALFFLNLTITQGTLYGLIFYANIIQVNTSLFFNQSTLNPLQVIVSFVNLDLGFPLCFYNGMDDADKAGLQFVFPAYLLVLTMATILVWHYCLQRSPTTSVNSFLCRISTTIGERAVGVLSTLIYLSYSKLLRSVIEILTYSTIHLPSGDMYVWFYDGNVQYLRGKHTVLFVVAMATCTLFLLPYTIALTFFPIIEQHSEHNRLFNYLHKKANQIKPMNDAHYAPYKGKWRWWLGARLWLLVVMYTLNSVYSSDKPSLLLTIQALMVILFTISQASIQPFGEFHQLRHKLNRHTNFYNRLYNSLDLFYLLNYTALAMSMSYILGHSSDQTQITSVTVGVLVGLFVVMLMATVLYHLIVAILRVFKMYDRTRERINGLLDKKKYETMVPRELDEPTNNAVSATTVTVNCGLRVPLHV